jgi:hypothetical protein
MGAQGNPGPPGGQVSSNITYQQSFIRENCDTTNM